MFRIFAVAVTLALASFPVSADDVLCKHPANSAVLTKNPDVRFLIFGESHGTQEAPATFAELVCFVAATDAKVLVGLELSEYTKTALTNYIGSKGSAQDEQTFLSESHWVLPVEQADGRSSVAMLDMVKRLRLLKEQGLDLTVVPFARYADISESQTPYEKGLAKSLIESAEQDDYDFVMVLVGSIHALKTQEYELPFEPMAMHLPQDSLLSILMVHSGGTIWNCSPTCERKPAKSGSKARLLEFRVGEAEFSTEEDKKLIQGFDGVYNLGIVSASPPVQ